MENNAEPMSRVDKNASRLFQTNSLKQDMISGAKTGTVVYILFGPIIKLLGTILVWTPFLLVGTVRAVQKYIQERLIKGDKDFTFSYNWGVREREKLAASQPKLPPPPPVTADTMYKAILKQWVDTGKPLPPAGKLLELKEVISAKLNRAPLQ